MTSHTNTNTVSRLRRETADVHHRLHDHPLMTDHVLTNIHQLGYHGFLSSFLAPWRYLESQAHVLTWPGGAPMASLIPALSDCLVQDLQCLNMSPQTKMGRIHFDALCPLQCVGLAYTLLGSSMGARVIFKVIVDQWPNAPTHYLLEAQKRRHWPAFVKAMKKASWSLPQQDKIVEGALYGFHHVEMQLNQAKVRFDSTHQFVL